MTHFSLIRQVCQIFLLFSWRLLFESLHTAFSAEPQIIYRKTSFRQIFEIFSDLSSLALRFWALYTVKEFRVYP